jgi:phosphopantothenoylcysteine decarboxylase/phosphopantothenate--cysteine ligase
MLKKNIIIGVTGGIAAYKAAILVRQFVKNGSNVKVLMSPFSKNFITPLTLATLSKNPVFSDFYNPENGDWNSHVDLGLWADAFIIAPATANSIAKMANGIADNLLLTTYLAAKCPIFIAPTMDLDMFKHPATQQNIQTLAQRGNIIIDANSGELASGLEGKGRMAEPEQIYQTVENFFSQKNDFKNKKVLITAGPTYEHFDPVRFIGNHSSGKMGYALAEEFANRGAFVNLISGPVNITTNNPNIKIHKVVSALEMFNKTNQIFDNTDIAIFAAAVADYSPVEMANSKIKKKNNTLTIKLKKNPDIALEMGKKKKKNQITIGFALETDNEQKNALEKLKKKNLDLIVLNSLKDKGAGFNTDTNKIKIIFPDGNIKNFDLKPKKIVAQDIANETKFILQKKY